MEIEVGDYVRTQGGYIYKALGEQLYLDNTGETVNFIEDIVKHRKIISEIVEVGDYVNGLRVEYITNEAIFTSGLAHGILFEDIRTVVTHEQFSQMEYKVETEDK